MERLTEKDEQGNKLVLKNSVECFGDELRHWSISKSLTGTQTIRGYAVDKFAEYEDLEEQGLLLKLPCKVGDTVYRINKGAKEPVIPLKVINFKIFDNKLVESLKMECADKYGGGYVYRKTEIGKTVFLTQAEAEEALKGMEREE